MSHLSRHRVFPVRLRLRASLAVLAHVTVAAVGLLFPQVSGAVTQNQMGTAAALVPPGYIASLGYKVDGEQVQGLGNWNDCMDYKISAGMHYCPGFFFFIPTPPYPTPCIDFDYREPSAVVEVTCTGKPSLNPANFTDAIRNALGGSNQAANQSKCVADIKMASGDFRRAFNDVIVRTAASPVSRFAMNPNPIQVAQSYTCGIAGAVGNMDMLQNLQNFNLGDMLDPSAWQASINNSIQSVQTSLQQFNMESMFGNLGEMFNGDFITNAINDSVQGLQTMGQDFMTGLQGSFTQMQTMLQGLSAGNLPIQGLDLNTIGQSAQNFLNAGDLMGAAAAIQGDGNLLNLAIGAYTAGNALNNLMQTQNQQEAQSLADSTQTALNLGLQGVSETAVTAGNTAFYATNFTPASFAQSNGDLEVKANIGTMSSQAAGQLVGRGQPTNLPNDSYASWSFIARMERVGNQIKPVGFIEDGQSQVVLNTMLENISATLGWVNGVSQFMVTRALADAQSFTPAQLCSSGKQLDNALASLKQMRESLGPDSSPTIIIPRGSYLNSAQFQVVPQGAAAASCPLTHAGFVARASDPAKLDMKNCTSICTGGGDEPRVCRIVPKAGFGGSCYANALSVQTVNGLYPACNGYKPTRVANGMGGWRTAGTQYNASTDHLKRISSHYRTQLMQAEGRATQKLTQAKASLSALVSQQGGACTALGNPTGPKEWLARTPDPSKAMSAQQTGVNLLQGTFDSLANTPADPDLARYFSSMDVDNNLMGMSSMLDQITASLDAGVVNVVASRAAMLDPGVLPAVVDTGAGRMATVPGVTGVFQDGTNIPLNLSHSGWTVGNYTNGGNIMSATFASLNGGAGMVGELAGCSTKLLLDMAPSSMQPVAGTQCWGDMSQRTGYSFHQIPAIQKEAAGTRATFMGEDLNAIIKNTSPPERPQVFNVEGLNERSTATTQGMPSLGAGTTAPSANSKCYPLGTLNPAHYTPGESVLPTEALGNAVNSAFDWSGSQKDADDGTQVLTYWKNTKCCIPPSCPQNIRQDW